LQTNESDLHTDRSAKPFQFAGLFARALSLIKSKSSYVRGLNTQYSPASQYLIVQ